MVDIQQIINEQLMTPKESAGVLDLESETFRQYLYSGRWPYDIIRVGKKPMLRRSDVARWKAERSGK